MNIKIFVSHRIDFDSKVLKNNIFTPVYCGAVYKNDKWDTEILGDNTGDNISEKRNSYCELTVQYWAWKNVEADYYGLCHYRRYFSFSEEKYKEDNYSNIVETYLNNKKEEKYNLNNVEKIKKEIENYDIVITNPFNVTLAGHKNVAEQYISNYYLEKEDLKIVLDVIKKVHPEYLEVAKETFESKYFIPCNMFIMNKKYFQKYCEWLYEILFEVEKCINLVNVNTNRKRVIGHIAERLLTIYVNYLKKEAKIKYLQRIMFLKPESIVEIDEINRSFIPVVLSSSNYYVPYLYVTLYSMLKHASKERCFDIIILNVDIDNNNKLKINTLMDIYSNCNVRFFDIGSLIENYRFIPNNHVSVETFYRLFIPEIFKNYKKIVFLDSDLVVKSDISELFEKSNDEFVINATRDADYESQYYSSKMIKEYTDSVLKIDNIKDYFQAGVIVFNIELFNLKYNLTDLLDYASSREFIYVDQDVLNTFLVKNINYIDLSWNVMSDCAGIRKNNIQLFASSDTYTNYMEARKKPNIIHYAGFAKPWDRPEDDFAMDFWNVARETIFYEIILSRMIDFRSWNIVRYNENSKKISFINKLIIKFIPKDQEKKIIIKNKLNNFVSIFAPPGSKQRQKLKKAYFKLRGWPINF